jgi:ParB family chromosome partitioning protein
MTAAVSARNARRACVHGTDDTCSVHGAAFPEMAKTCWGANKGFIELDLEKAAKARSVAPMRRTAAAGERPEHGPECPDGPHAHVFTPASPAAPAVPPAAGAATTPAAAPEPTPDGSAPRAIEAVEQAAPEAAPAAGSRPTSIDAVPRGAESAHFAQAPAALPPAAGAASLLDLPLDLVDVGDNVRVNLEDLEELAASIAEHGVLQPVKATGPHPDGRYLVTWGQRRTLASRMAGAATIRAMVLPPEADVDRHGSARSIEQLVENLHRKDLPALDRARAMREVIDGGKSQADLARELGIAPSTVANDLGLLEAPEPIQALIAAGSITPAHAKAMKGLAPKSQVELAQDVVARGYSAHRTEEEVQLRKRNAELEAKNQRESAALLEARRKAVDAVIAEQVAKGVATDVVVVVGGGYCNGGSEDWLIARLKAGGFVNARKASGWQEAEPRPGGAVCDCRAYRAKVTESSRWRDDGGRLVNYGLSWATACVNSEHRVARSKATEERRVAREAKAHRVQQAIKRTASGWALPEARAIAIDRILAEAMLWDLLSYQIPTWAGAHGGKKTNPFAAIHALSDEDLAKELAERIAGDFRDKAGYHVDWDALAAEYGVEDPS